MSTTLRITALALILLFGINPASVEPLPQPLPVSLLFNFDDLEAGEGFYSTHQPYQEHVQVGDEWWGITIDAMPNGDPRVVLEGLADQILENIGESEFGTSEFSNLHISFRGFLAEKVEVDVGLLSTDGNMVTAQLVGYYDGEPVDDVRLELGKGPAAVQQVLRLDPKNGEPMDGLVLSYGYSISESPEDAQLSEAIDDLLLHVYQGIPPTPLPDITAPVVHILRPLDGDTVDDGWVVGYVVENRGLNTEVSRVLNNATSVHDDIHVFSQPTWTEGEQRYHFYGRLAMVDGENYLRFIAEDQAQNVTVKDIEVIYDPPGYESPPDEWPEDLDFVARGMEVTQAIQSYNNIDDPLRDDAYATFELPAGKTTLVRVYADVLGIESPVTDVNVALHALDSSLNDLEGSPIYPAKRVTLDPSETWKQQRKHADKSFNFILPPEWTHGMVRLVADVNEANGVPEVNYDYYNNAITDVLFTETEELCLFVYRINSVNEEDVTPTTRETYQNLKYLRAMYPVTAENLIIYQRGTIETERILNSGDDDEDDDQLHDLANDFRRYLGLYYGLATVAICNNDAFLGLTDHTVTHRGTTISSKAVSLSVASDSDFYLTKTPHEIGHGRGLGHVQGCDDPDDPYEYYPPYKDPEGGFYDDASIGNWGVLIKPDNSFELWNPDDTDDFMSYCGDRWISYRIWNRLFDGFGSSSLLHTQAASAISPAASPPLPLHYLIIAGSIEDEAVINPAWRRLLPPGSSDHEGTGDYGIRLLDALGNVLFTRWFMPERLADLETHLSFYELLPAVPGTQAIVLVQQIDSGTVLTLAQVAAGPAVPSVDSVVMPYTGQSWAATGTEVVEWSASDADPGDMLIYTVSYSPDNGSTWSVIGADLTDTSLVVDLAEVPGCDACRIKVMVSDGINSNDTDSAAFSKGNLPPEVQILSPANGGVFEQDEIIVLEAQVFDMENIVIPAEDIVWTSSIDGILAKGQLASTTDLSLGLHTLRLSAQDSQQFIDQAFSYIYVLGEDTDDDGIPDNEDPSVGVPCTDPQDSDGDGVGDSCDNCLWLGNPVQRDVDDDGDGDVCDVCPLDPENDADGDGICGDIDNCPGTYPGALINTSGCAIDQLCPCDEAWKNHGKYVSCVAHAADGFVEEGVITDAEKDAIVSEAAKSKCGK